MNTSHIIPTNITNYNRDDKALQAFAFFSVAVAGKNSDSVARFVNALVDEAGDDGVLSYLDSMTDLLLLATLQRHRTGKYKTLTSAVRGLAQLDLRTCTIEDLEKIKGIGPKTSRFFLLHSRPDADVAVLDVHILRWMRRQGVRTPPATPQNPTLYSTLENVYTFLRRQQYPSMSPAQADLHIWKEMRA